MKLLTLKNTQKTSKNQSKYFKFTLFFALITSIPLLTVGLFNVIIDPYDAYQSPILLGINQEKPKKENIDRLYKSLDIIRIKPNTILLGSSRVKGGLSPNHPALNKYKPVYNSGLNGTNTYELRRYLEHAIYNNKDLKLVVLGLDFFMFNQNSENPSTFSEQRLEKRFISSEDFVNTTLSLETLFTSLETLSISRQNIKIGLANYQNNTIKERNGFTIQNKANILEKFNQYLKESFELYSEYKFSAHYFNEFQQIVTLCRENNIKLVVFISPINSLTLESIYLTGKGTVFEDFKKEIVTLTPVWDFSGYNSITTESVSQDMKNYIDPSHYTPRVGDLILDRIFNQKTDSIPDDFGVLITPENIESHLAKIRKDREIWVQNNPNEIQLVKKIYAQVLEQKMSESKKIKE